MHNTIKGDVPSDEYVKNFRRLAEELQLAGAPIDEGSTIFAFLRDLGSKYAPFIVSTTINLRQLTFDDIVASLKTHDVMQNFYH